MITGFVLFGFFQRHLEIWFKYPCILNSTMNNIYEMDYLIKIYMLLNNFHVCEGISHIRLPLWHTFFLIDMIKDPPYVFFKSR